MNSELIAKGKEIESQVANHIRNLRTELESVQLVERGAGRCSASFRNG